MGKQFWLNLPHRGCLHKYHHTISKPSVIILLSAAEYQYDPNGNYGGYVRFWSTAGTNLPSRSNLLVNYTGAVGHLNHRGNYLKLGSYMYNWKHNTKVRNSRNAGVSVRDYGWDDVGVTRGREACSGIWRIEFGGEWVLVDMHYLT